MRILAMNRIPLVGFLALLLLCCSRLARSQAANQAIRLPNNSSITLLGWSYGTYHELVRGKESRHVNISPPVRPDPNELASCETEEDALVFWIRRVGPAAKVDNINVHLWWIREQVRMADESGHEIAPTIAHWRMNRTTSPNALTDDPIALAAFPRRGRLVILRVYSVDGTHVIGEFRIPNPVRNPAPPFSVARFPVTRRSGDLELTLEPVAKGRPRHFLQTAGRGEMYTDVPLTPFGYRPAPGEERRMESHAVFTFRGRISTHWSLDAGSIEMWDSSGNRLQTDMTGAGNDRLCYLPPNIGEPVRVRLAAVQRPDNEFKPDRVWSVPGVRAPAARAVVNLDRGIHLDDCDMRLLGIAGAGLNRVGPAFIAPAPEGSVAVVVRISYGGRAPDLYLRVSEVRSGEWRSSPWLRHGGGLGSTWGDYVFWVKAPAGGERLDLTFGFNRARLFEFVLPVAVR